MKRINGYYLWFIALAFTYSLLILMVPPDASVLVRYGLTPGIARLVSLSLAIPVMTIWFMAFYGFIQFKQYANLIKKNQDGQSLAKVANGLMVLAFGLPLGSLCSTALNYIAARNSSLIPATVIINNYIMLGFVLVGFAIIYQGTKSLTELTQNQERRSVYDSFAVALLVIFSIAYCYITLTNPARQFPPAGVRRAAYYMSDIPLIFTIIVPYLFVWFYGIRSTFLLRSYRSNVPGKLYKQALGYLAAGLGTVIISQMLLRFLVSLTTLLNSLSLQYLLMVLYGLVLIIGTGYVLIAMGSKKLKKIEEV